MKVRSNPVRLLYFVIGWCALALGVLGVVLPVMPTVPFLVVAAWAFSKSSRRFHDWLYNHPHFGSLLRDWDQYRVVPVWGKIWACLAMAGGLTITAVSGVGIWLTAAVAVVMAAVAAYLLSKPSRRPRCDPAVENRRK